MSRTESPPAARADRTGKDGRTGTGGGGVPVRHAHVIVIGGGLAGLAAAIRLRRDGCRDLLILERGDDVGGTWRDNTYPGAACDVPSHLYSYSFAPNPRWSRSFSPQAEIQDYIAAVARRYRMQDAYLLGREVQRASWDAAAARWVLETGHGRYTANVVVAAFGALCEPARPGIPGLDTFAGEVFHSARWDHKADLAGKRVAVIGTGASAIQIVPAIAPQVAELQVYQRTPPWVLPRLDRRFSRVERFAHRWIPPYRRLLRLGLYWAHEAQAVGLARKPALMKPLELVARAKLRYEVPDRALRRRLTPDYALGCKRILLSNSYYPAFRRPNVELVSTGIAAVGKHSIRTTDGVEHPVDAIVLATGFQVTDSPAYRRIFGKDGRSLGEVFDTVGRQCYKGTAIANFPNFFMLVGPNTGLGHSSMIFMIESQVNYVADAVATMRRLGLRTVEIRRDTQEAFMRMLQERLSRSVWNAGGCSSWYLDKHGLNTTMWPGFSFEFRRITRRFDVSAYETRPDAVRADAVRPNATVPGGRS